MKCKICGSESGSYPLCRTCYAKREAGEIIKCVKCGSWHYAGSPCHCEEGFQVSGPPLKRSFHFYMKQNHLL